jgi:hypothetical protein
MDTRNPIYFQYDANKTTPNPLKTKESEKENAWFFGLTGSDTVRDSNCVPPPCILRRSRASDWGEASYF